MVKNQHGVRSARRLIAVQSIITLLLTRFALISSEMAAKSALVGGLICIVPTICFARFLFRCHGAQFARQIVWGFYSGEALKLGLTAVLFAVVFARITIIPSVLFFSYCMVQLVFWLAPLIIVNKEVGRC